MKIKKKYAVVYCIEDDEDAIIGTLEEFNSEKHAEEYAEYILHNTQMYDGVWVEEVERDES